MGVCPQCYPVMFPPCDLGKLTNQDPGCKHSRRFLFLNILWMFQGHPLQALLCALPPGPSCLFPYLSLATLLSGGASFSLTMLFSYCSFSLSPLSLPSGHTILSLWWCYCLSHCYTLSLLLCALCASFVCCILSPTLAVHG